MVRIACVVEGHGEVEALPVLLRRISAALEPSVPLVIPRPIRIPRTRLVKQPELQRAMVLASRTAGPGGGVLVFQVSRFGEDQRFEGGPLRVPANALRAREADA